MSATSDTSDTSSAPSRAVALYGTDEAVAPPRILRAGKLSAELDGGNLRYVRWDGAEVLRAVSFIVRDKDWGTYNPAINSLSVQEGSDGFRVELKAVASDDGQSFAYEARIEGGPDGRLSFEGRGKTEEGFLTNRTGFVVLHPIDGVAGAPVAVEHTDGTVEETRFPEIIDPLQPMMDLRALTHTTPEGLRVETRMEGDTYEMEDQRNWTDASYKTYVRPLAKPWPYRIEPGERIEQRVVVTISGDGGASADAGAVAVAPGAEAGTMPPLGIGLRPEDVEAARGAAVALREMGPAHVVLHHDPRAGHGRDTLEAMLAVARDIGAEPWLEAVVAAVEDGAARREVAALGALAQEMGQPFATVLVSPAPDLKCTLPGSEWPDAPDAAALYDAAREAFPGARIGGGMFSYFTELNRKRPPVAALDLVSFTTSPMVHAGDDRSVMETREAHPAIAASAARIADGTPWAVGPSAIGVRDNPYGEAAKDNPGNIRQAMNRNDPRQRGLLGAAWTLGYVADFAAGGAEAVAMGGATGPFGVLWSDESYPQPWYDDRRGGLFPVYHVMRGLARLRGGALSDIGLKPRAAIGGLAARGPDGVELWLANMGPDAAEVSLPDGAAAAVLDADGFAAAADDPAFLDQVEPVDGPLRLDAHAVARAVLV